MYQNEYDLEDIVNNVNDILYQMCERCDLIKLKSFVLNEKCIYKVD